MIGRNQNKKEPPNMGLFSVNQNVRLIKEDETNVGLFMSIIDKINYNGFKHLFK